MCPLIFIFSFIIMNCVFSNTLLQEGDQENSKSRVIAAPQATPTEPRHSPYLSGGAAWDSGFIPFNRGETKVLSHNLGGDTDDYIVFMQFYAPGQGALNQAGYGGYDLGKTTWGVAYDNYQLGAYWHTLTNTAITVYRREDDYCAENIRIRIWVDDAPDWDSNWVNLTPGAAATKLNHNLGGSADDYVVDVQQKSASQGVNHMFYGGADLGSASLSGTSDNHRVGAYWFNLDNANISLYRREEDTFAEKVRVRIWKSTKPTYDTHWETLADLGKTYSFTHAIGGNPEDYLVDLQFRHTSWGVHHIFYGGSDMGTETFGGLSEDDPLGAWWSHLSNTKIRLFRREADAFATEARIRIWNFWKPSAPEYDSDWKGIKKDAPLALAHDVGGGWDRMLVDMQCMGTNGAVNHDSYGGMDLGPPKYPDYRSGSYWAQLDGDNILVKRRDEDEVSSSVRVRIWSMPKPDYDSDWVAITAGAPATVLNHNLGGDVDDYLVHMQNSSVEYGKNHIFYGGGDFGSKVTSPFSQNDRVGTQYRNLTNSSISIYRRAEDVFGQNIRVRIWRTANPDFDSSFQSIGAGASQELSHNLQGNRDRYFVQMDYSDDAFLGRNNFFYGGNIFRASPPSGYSAGDAVGAAWSNLTKSDIQIYRHAQDGFADNIRVRIWRTPSLATAEQIIDYLLGISAPEDRMISEADTNGDHIINIADVLYLLSSQN